MAAPARRSLRERDQRAIDPTPLPGQTTIDIPDASPPPRPKPASTGRDVRRLGIYFHPADFTAAKAAYLANWQADGDADTFAKWIATVLVDHAQLDPAQRAGLTLPARTDGSGSTRSFALPGSVHQAVHAAVVVDQNAGRWVSVSTWAAIAVHAAAQDAEQRAGGRLPIPPTRLPNRLQR